MDNETTARVSRRWDEPTVNETGTYWTARLRCPLLPGESGALSATVFGPDRDAVIRETVRADRAWARYPAQHGDAERSGARVRYLASVEGAE